MNNRNYLDKDIINHILEYLDKTGDIIALAQTSRQFYTDAQDFTRSYLAKDLLVIVQQDYQKYLSQSDKEKFLSRYQHSLPFQAAVHSPSVAARLLLGLTIFLFLYSMYTELNSKNVFSFIKATPLMLALFKKLCDTADFYSQHVNDIGNVIAEVGSSVQQFKNQPSLRFFAQNQPPIVDLNEVIVEKEKKELFELDIISHYRKIK